MYLQEGERAQAAAACPHARVLQSPLAALTSCWLAARRFVHQQHNRGPPMACIPGLRGSQHAAPANLSLRSAASISSSSSSPSPSSPPTACGVLAHAARACGSLPSGASVAVAAQGAQRKAHRTRATTISAAAQPTLPPPAPAPPSAATAAGAHTCAPRSASLSWTRLRPPGLWCALSTVQQCARKAGKHTSWHALLSQHGKRAQPCPNLPSACAEPAFSLCISRPPSPASSQPAYGLPPGFSSGICAPPCAAARYFLGAALRPACGGVGCRPMCRL